MRRKREERRRKNGGLRQLTPTHKAQDECCYYLLTCVCVCVTTLSKLFSQNPLLKLVQADKSQNIRHAYMPKF